MLPMLQVSVWLGGTPLTAHEVPDWLASDQLTPEPAGSGCWSEIVLMASDLLSLSLVSKPKACPGLT